MRDKTRYELHLSRHSMTQRNKLKEAVMPIGFTTSAELPLPTLQTRIDHQEACIQARLLSITEWRHRGVDFNAHTYQLIDDDATPVTRRFIVTDGGDGANDPAIKAFLEQDSKRKIVFQGKVFIQSTLQTI